jgi:hypothetical protein
MQTMLEGMRKIQWAELETASGNGTGVPDMIRDLTHNDPDVAEEALLALSSTIWEHGIVFDATIHAIPFLIEILAANAAADPAGVIDLLEQIATSRDIEEVNLPPAHEYQFMPEESEDYTKDEQEMQWSREAYDAVALGMAQYRRLLHDDDPVTRASTAQLVRLFPAAARENAAAVRDAIDVEEDIPALTDLMLCLRDILSGAVMLDTERSEYITYYGALFEAEEDPVLRLAAAVSVAKLAPTALTADMREVMIDGVIKPQSYAAYLTDTLENPVHQVLDTLQQLDSNDRTPLMLRALRETRSSGNAQSIALTLLVETFGQEPLQNYVRKRQHLLRGTQRINADLFMPIDGEENEVTLREQLDAPAGELADAVLNSDAFWASPTNMLMVFGLPADRQSLMDYLEKIARSSTNS